jgi:copper chaperone CopZ
MNFIKPLLFLIVLTLASTSIIKAQSPNTTQQSDSVITATVKVKGITCSSDLKTIATNVEKLKGVKSCKPGKTGPTSTFEIRYTSSLVSEKEIYAAIEETGGCKNPADRPYKVKK